MTTFIFIVIAASIARYLVGIAWYLPKGLFGKKWMTLQGADLDCKPDDMGKRAFIGFFATLVSTAILAFFVVLFAVSATILHAFMVVPVLWVGFIAYAMVQRKIYDPRKIYSWKLFWIDSMYELVGMLVATTIILTFI